MEAKKSNQIKDFQHKLSKTMIVNTRANTIIVGDLNVKNMAQSKKVTGKKMEKENVLRIDQPKIKDTFLGSSNS